MFLTFDGEHQSTQPAYHLGHPRSLENGDPIFMTGEYIFVRIPEDIRVEGHDGEATVVGTDLPPTSNGSSPQHFAFVRLVNPLPGNACILEVYPVLSFGRTGGAVSTYNTLANITKAALLPLSFRHPTPDSFGPPLDLGNWSNSRDLFLHVIPRRLVMPAKMPFKRMDPPLIMPFSELSRIDQYREYLRSYTQTTNADGQSHPPPNGGSGDEQVAEAELGGFSVEPTHGLLVLEGVDEDADDADATFRDELVMLARDDPIWREELRRYLQEEEKERELMQKERVARLAHWREDISV
ncbi:hypothetical protein M378DRAFT_332913 [Amanita muscaria Koide BX008]|uniref:Uncharacterized protein n=1 Tax=Amanita muscaria (strain Koide BX008) TaxID=946122 RepID=A0A0C2WPY4_AMAMK|nr:hypothetical protein M378DRAFT_332913 [Amanita muscaria Koide BX008]